MMRSRVIGARAFDTIAECVAARPKKSAARKLRFALGFQGDLGRPVPLEKYFAGFVGQISSPVAPSHPPGGAVAIVTNAGCGGRDSVGARVCSQGGFRERAAGAQDERRCFRLRQDFGRWVSNPPKPLGEAWGRLRQNRVVLTPVAGAKSAEACRPNRAPASHQSADEGDKTNSAPGSTA